MNRSGAAAVSTIDPGDVQFSQSSIRASFRDGRAIDELADGLRAGAIRPEDTPPIRPVEREGKRFTPDNRRLEAFRWAEVAVPHRMTTPEEVWEESWKFTTRMRARRSACVEHDD